jgi:hypothetical protein
MEAQCVIYEVRSAEIIFILFVYAVHVRVNINQF